MIRICLALLFLLVAPALAVADIWYEGNFIQGGMVIGHAEPDSSVTV